MRLLHTSDWHLGLTLGGVSLLREQREWAEELVQIVREKRADAVLIAGDVFDRAVAPAEAVALYDQTITRIVQDCGAQILLLAGNHDGAARLSQLGALLCNAGVWLAGSLTARPAPVCFPDCECWLIPFFHPEQVRLLYPDCDIRTANDAMRVLMDDIRARHNPRKRLVVGAHCFVTGAVPAESDYGAQLGGASQIAAAVFAGADYVALGHLHRAQTVAPGVRYSGAPYPYAFSESAGSVTIFDTQDGALETVQFHPTRTLRKLCGCYEEVLVQAESDMQREDYMHIVLADRAAGLETLDTLHALYPNLVTLTGQAWETEEIGTLTVEETRTLSPRALLARFCEENGGFSPTETQIETFMQALVRVREGDGEV